VLIVERVAQSLVVQRLCGLFAGAFEIVICADVSWTSSPQPGVALWPRVDGSENEPQRLKSTNSARRAGSEDAARRERPYQSNFLTDAEHFAQQHEE
jgi:hypothetical protein